MKTKTDLKSGWWYTVNKGDTLYAIAKRYLNDGEKWRAIYKFRDNKTIIGPNPDMLTIGMKIEMKD